MSNGRWKLSAESITAAAAVVAALIALVVGIWENVQERRHNRLSVLPHLDFVAELRNRESPDSADRAMIRLVSEGVGPAVVDEVRFAVVDSAGSRRNYESWDAVRRALEDWGIRVSTHSRLDEGTVLGVGREYMLFDLETTEQPRGAAGHPFDRLLHQLEIVVDYHSIYGDEFRSTFRVEGRE